MHTTLRHHRGFTLIELMVVVTIIGIMSGLIVMNIVTSDPQKDLNREAQRLLAVIEMAQDEALFGRQDIGIVITEYSYSFARYAIPEGGQGSTQQSELTSTDLGIGSASPGSPASPSSPNAPTTRVEPEWLPIEDDHELRPYELSEDYEIVLEVDDQMVDITGGKKDASGKNEPSKFDNDDRIRPAIFISPSNEMTPFVLEIYLKEDSNIMVKLSGDETGRLWIGDDEEF